MKAVVEHLRSEVAEKFEVQIDLPVPSETDVRKSARRLFEGREDARKALAAKDMVLFEAPASTHFRISDRPVTLDSSLPFGDIGLTSRGVTICMPIGQRLMLGLLCPSIGRKLSRVPIEKLNLPSATRARLIALRTGLASSSVVTLDEEEVRRHNALQIAGSTRFVYGPSDDFADVEQIIATNPDLREVTSSVHFGKMGEGPAPRQHMPAGSWLVLYGRNDAHMLEVLDAVDKEPLELTLKSQSALRAAVADGPFSEVQYYVDQQIVRGMRDVHLVPIPDAARVKVQVRHFDPGLDELMKVIDQRSR